MTKDMLELVKECRFYVVFVDGSWRTATAEQWKSEQLWKLDVSRSFWFGGPDAALALELICSRIEKKTP